MHMHIYIHKQLVSWVLYIGVTRQLRCGRYLGYATPSGRSLITLISKFTGFHAWMTCYEVNKSHDCFFYYVTLRMPRPIVMFTLVKYLIPVWNHTGMLSKSKGQIIRVAATMHVLFNTETPLAVSKVISDAAIKAAINLVDVCIQHAALLAGRGDVDETVQEMMKG